MTKEDIVNTIRDRVQLYKSDMEIATEIGIARHAVSTLRARHNIPAGTLLARKAGVIRGNRFWESDGIDYVRCQARWADRAEGVWFGPRRP